MITYKELAKKLEELPPPQNMSREDKKLYCQVGQALLITELELLINKKEWALGIMMGVSMLDFVGKTRLIWKCLSTSTSKIMSDKFATTIELLYKNKIINDSKYERLKEIKKIRNNLAHNLLLQRARFHDREPDSDLQRIIEDIINLIGSLLTLPFAEQS